MTTPARAVSLRRRMLLTTLLVVGPVVAGLAGVLYFAVQRAIWARFDEDLTAVSGTVADLVEYDWEDGYEVELGPRPQPLSRSAGGQTHFELWAADGTLLSRTAGLGGPLPRGRAHGLVDRRLSSGAAVRVYERTFVPAVEGSPTEPVEAVTLIVARETRSTTEMLGALASWFFGLGLVTLGLASFAAWTAVRRGLAPVGQVAGSIAEIDDSGLAERLDVAVVPRELQPLVGRVNDLLARLESAFERERQFTADVAHELRTPLSVLRTELELSLRRPRTADAYRDSQVAALELTVQLSTLVDNLLLLARLDHLDQQGAPALDLERFDLAGLVEACWVGLAERAEARGVSFEGGLRTPDPVETDREKLRLVVANLLANAAEYTEAGGWIRVERDVERGLFLAVVDSGPAIPADVRERVFDRFWRRDEARGDAGVHCGIGLPLARSVAGHLGLDLRLVDRPDGAVAFELRGPKSTELSVSSATPGGGR